MGAPKQKWTSEEEVALREGIDRYGRGKWSTILKDPKFGAILHLRSNVDLKDKWRNLNVAANGLGSRHRVKLALKHTPKVVKHGDMTLSTVVQDNLDVINAMPLSVVNGTSEYSEPACTKKPMPRLDNLILDAIAKLKEPHGSSRAAISKYIEEKYIAPPKLEGLVATTLKLLTQNGKLIKVKRQYMIVPLAPISEIVVTTDTSKSAPEGKLEMPKVDTTCIEVPSLYQVEAELEKMKSMTAEEAAAAAARAVAEAEAAIWEAEEAEKEAEQAEAKAEAAGLFADAVINAFKMQNSLHLNAFKASKL